MIPSKVLHVFALPAATIGAVPIGRSQCLDWRAFPLAELYRRRNPLEKAVEFEP